jgi:hypothetical protein
VDDESELLSRHDIDDDVVCNCVFGEIVAAGLSERTSFATLPTYMQSPLCFRQQLFYA